MFKKVLMFVVLMVALASVSYADGPVGYPGSAWFSVVGPASTTGDEKHNVILQGKIEQGIDWFHLNRSETLTFNTFVSFGYSVDSGAFGYNNKAVPALGAKLSFKPTNNGVIGFGVQAIHEDRWLDDVHSNGVQAFVTGWFGWNLKK